VRLEQRLGLPHEEGMYSAEEKAFFFSRWIFCTLRAIPHHNPVLRLSLCLAVLVLVYLLSTLRMSERIIGGGVFGFAQM